jgi:mono/diheme cytochrome c family protein
LEESSDNSAGESIFSQNCVRCHGEHGKGDGDIAASLKPRPQDLTGNDGRLKDDYLFWRISEGGLAAPFASAMPAWKGILDEEQIWQVVSFLRTLQ